MEDNAKSDKQYESKVGRLIEKYGLGSEYGADLEERWLGKGKNRESLRDLADRFNMEILAVSMEEAEMMTITEEIENIYRLLTDDEITGDKRTKTRRRLERNGVDVKTLERDFVTYQAIRSYLKDYRGAEYQQVSTKDRINRTSESIERLRSRFTIVCESNLEQLQSSDKITLGDFHLFVNANVLCQDCNAQYSINELLDRGGCDCDNEKIQGESIE